MGCLERETLSRAAAIADRAEQLQAAYEDVLAGSGEGGGDVSMALSWPPNCGWLTER